MDGCSASDARAAAIFGFPDRFDLLRRVDVLFASLRATLGPGRPRNQRLRVVRSPRIAEVPVRLGNLTRRAAVPTCVPQRPLCGAGIRKALRRKGSKVAAWRRGSTDRREQSGAWVPPPRP